MVDVELLAFEWSEFQVHLNQIKPQDSTDSLSESLRCLDLVIDRFATRAELIGWKKGNW